MPFRLINNRMQSFAVKGFVVNVIVSVILALLKILPIDITLPFLMIWILLWLIGTSANNKPEA